MSVIITVVRNEKIVGLWKGVAPVSACKICYKPYITFEFSFIFSAKFCMIIDVMIEYGFPFQSLSRTVPGIGVYFSSLHWLRSNFG